MVIFGDNGVGKSTLFKVISENRREGSGKVTLPYGKKLYFLPTDPSIAIGNVSLKELLAYPDPVETYTPQRYEEVFKEVLAKNHAKFNLNDETKLDWSRLSAGERQQMSIVRAILNEPDILLMDESTRAMDAVNQKNAYKALEKLLPNTTLISVAHSETVLGFHERIIRLLVNKKQKAVIQNGRVEFFQGQAKAVMEPLEEKEEINELATALP